MSRAWACQPVEYPHPVHCNTEVAVGAAQYGNVIDGHVNCLELTPDDRFVAAAGNPWLRIFDCEYTSAPYASYEGGHRDNITGVNFEEDAK